MSDESDPEVVDALARLERIDSVVARDAAAALNWLTWDMGLETITQRGLQDFLWYELPTKWSDDGGWLAVAGALAQLLDLVGLSRYADICRSEPTTEVLAAYERSPSEGFAAFRKACQRSGVVPRDLPATDDRPALVWGSVMGSQEACAYESTAAALELAAASGDLRPGTRGWRGRQRDVAVAYLIGERDPLTGETLLDTVFAERLQRWVDGGGEARRRLVARVANQLLHHVPVPRGASEAVEPLRWLLREIGAGLALTAAYRLDVAFVLRASRHLGWYDDAHPPRTETDVPELHELHTLARQLGVVRRVGRRVCLTRSGRDLTAEPDVLWRFIARQLAAGDGFDAAVAELALASLIPEGPLGLDDLSSLLADALAGEGWRTDGTSEAPSEPPGAETVYRSLWTLIRPARLLGFLSLEGDWGAQAVMLTDVGIATALVALRDRATGPMRDFRTAASRQRARRSSRG